MPIALWLLAAVAAVAASPEQIEYERLDEAAACLIRKDRAKVAKWAAAKPGSAEEASAGERLAAPIAKCAGGFDPGQLAGAVGQRLFNRYATRRISLPGSPAERNLFANAVLQGATDLEREAGVLRCVVLMYPEASEGYVRTKFGSPLEARARPALIEAIAQCTPAGEQIRWTGLSLRLGVARQVFATSPAAHLASGAWGAGAEEAARAR